MAAMRMGKIDITDRISFKQAQTMQKTNPEILQMAYPDSATSLDPRNDRAPFNDIRVRKAMQMAIDLPTIAKSHWGGIVSPYPCSITSNYMKGWGFPYNQWPQDLKDEYAYNPQAAKKLLADAGYPHGFKTNIVAAYTSDLDLLHIVKSLFAQVGIEMEIRTIEPADLIAFAQTAHQHDQLVYGGSLGSGHEPLRQLTRFRTGSSGNPQLMVSDPVFDAFYPKALAAASVDEVKQIFKDANEYVARQHFAISLLQPIRYSLYQPWLKGYDGQFGSISWSPQSLSFYAISYQRILHRYIRKVDI
jgi:peptide/nickel transport system substrate-binding protein